MSQGSFHTASSRDFRPSHPWDRNFFLVMVGLAWVGIVRGFGGDIANHLAKHQEPYPIIVHFHAVVFVAWLVLFTVQILLVRFKKLSVHRQLGMAMVGLAAVMVVIGPSTALTVQHRGMNQPGADPAFLAIQFTDILAFAGLVAAAIWLRKAPSAHKRLILLATLYITDAGFARWLAGGLIHHFGGGFWGLWIAFYLGPNVLILLAGAYDLMTRRRLHLAYVAGLGWVLACQMTALILYGSPSWLACSEKLIALWPWS
ncbi:MAG TPA: hypothetical protein VHV47_09720 [Opitutaceae bacterium]|nr:hypothetical protein [Opitutaceae bacterium]